MQELHLGHMIQRHAVENAHDSTRECGEQAGQSPFLGRAAVLAAARLPKWEDGIGPRHEITYSPPSDWVLLQKALRNIQRPMHPLELAHGEFRQSGITNTTIKRPALVPGDLDLCF